MSHRKKAAALLSASLLTVTGIGVVTATTAQAAPGCRVDYAVTNQWPAGFGGEVTITNLGDPLSSWTVDWSYSAGQQISQLWNGSVSQTGGNVTVTSLPWNGSLATGARASFGFNASWSGSNPAPTSFRVNGTTCTGAVPTTGPTTTPPPPTPPPTTPPPTTPPPQTGDFFLSTDTQAFEAAAAASGETKTLLDKIAQTPQSYWVGDWETPAVAQQGVRDYTAAAAAAGKTGVLVVYAIPGRDCGNHSGGGVGESEYARWIDTVAAGIQGNPWVVLEPDALAQLGDCNGQGDRVGYLKYAAKALTLKGARVYIDIGHSGWLGTAEAARRLQLVGFEHAVGFALNTSNYQTTEASRAYGQTISNLTGGKTFVIDTSRNGNGSNGEWCNPRGRALGERPTRVGNGGLDALLWVKLPGESDGACNGGPAAGQWWQEIAIEMARNARW